MKKGLIVIAAVLLLAGCSKETVATSNETGAEATKAVQETAADTAAENTTETVTEGYQFTVNDVAVPMNVDAAPVIEALGEPTEYFEAASCAFQGLDKIYTYSGFEINTYPVEEKDFIASVYFLDDSVTTEEGVYLGSTLDEVIAAYGENYTEESGEYTYLLGQTKLSFIIEEDCVTAITYSAVVEGLE